MNKSVLIGLYVGLLSGIAAAATAYLVSALTGLWFSQLNVVSILLASLISNIIGGVIFTKFFQKTSRPKLYYVLLTAGVTLLLTVFDIANPPAENFGIVAHPVHIVVALFSMWLIPRWLKREGKSFVDTEQREPKTL
ncbi:hypothetical protein [Halobacillus naozhouensis]|uniref:Uncharacterized protein n=1 Tax=Halobacillus naozhouensis TaxID=554880 RepID=A0ABY8J202_9BACI|nr:hypothetical protein [Halobacillus naozhouensis]WFT76111.1 hypothetical protein P9989_07045 [Halobacillus naozhouensis]